MSYALTLRRYFEEKKCPLVLMCMQEPEHDPAGAENSSPAGQTKKRKRNSNDDTSVIDLSQEAAHKQPNAAALQCDINSIPDAKQQPDCMTGDSPKKIHSGIPAEQEQKAGTPEEKAALLAKLSAEAASLKQHVLGIQSLAPLTADNSEPSLSRSQASLKALQQLYPLLHHIWRRRQILEKVPDCHGARH